MKIFFRIIAALVLVAVAAFCAFGFLASFEPGNGLSWKVAYGGLACFSLGCAVAVVCSRAGRRVSD
jgi:uncharacterized membrane protein YkvI